MELAHVIKGPVLTEKAEAQKVAGIYTLKVDPKATKVDVKNALRRFYDVDVVSVRALRTVPKVRAISAHKSMQKRHREKRMIVKLSKKSKTLDLSAFKTS